MSKLILFFVIFFAAFTMLQFFTPYDTTDNIAKKRHSGFILYTDHLTGCQYLQAGLLGGGITPRLGRDGKQICTGSHR